MARVDLGVNLIFCNDLNRSESRIFIGLGRIDGTDIESKAFIYAALVEGKGGSLLDLPCLTTTQSSW